MRLGLLLLRFPGRVHPRRCRDRLAQRHQRRQSPGGGGLPVALLGGYGPDYDRLATAELSADRARPAGEYRIVLSDGEPLPPGTQVIGRGSRLHFLTGTSWYQLDMDDIPG